MLPVFTPSFAQILTLLLCEFLGSPRPVNFLRLSTKDSGLRSILEKDQKRVSKSIENLVYGDFKCRG